MFSYQMANLFLFIFFQRNFHGVQKFVKTFGLTPANWQILRNINFHEQNEHICDVHESLFRIKILKGISFFIHTPSAIETIFLYLSVYHYITISLCKCFCCMRVYIHMLSPIYFNLQLRKLFSFFLKTKKKCSISQTINPIMIQFLA